MLGGAGGGVSTHSRPKAAGYRDLPLLIERLVSTHSRPKATGNVRVQYVNNATVSTHSRPKAAGLRRRWPKILMHCFNSQPPEGGWCGTFRFPLMRWPFQLTAARRRLGKHNAEDVDSDMEDHAPDTLRYLCMTRVIAAPAPKKGSLRPEWLQFKPVA